MYTPTTSRRVADVVAEAQAESVAPVAELDLEDRFMRYADMVPIAALRDTPVTIIGVGAVGRPLALMLASMGVQTIQIIDFDLVDVPNLAVQGWRPDQLGRPKVAALADDLLAQVPENELHLEVESSRWRPNIEMHRVVFFAVDKMDVRTTIFRILRKQRQFDFVVDVRMSGEVVRVFAVTPSTAEDYSKTLFTDEQAIPERCTARSIMHTATLGASLMVAEYLHWLRGYPILNNMCLDLRSHVFIKNDTFDFAENNDGSDDVSTGSSADSGGPGPGGG